MPCEVKHPAIYQHWISKSGALRAVIFMPFSSLCFFFFLFKLQEKIIERVVQKSPHTMVQLHVAFGMKSWGWKCTLDSPPVVTSSHLDHSLSFLWAAKCDQSASDSKLPITGHRHKNISTYLNFPPRYDRHLHANYANYNKKTESPTLQFSINYSTGQLLLCKHK